ncbi:MAG: substrate-binding domain-containing protein [Eubacterium sp.]|nr:substrate-binding domain-containing protein [Eubacterium sp.]
MDRYLNIGLLIDDPNNYFTSQACKGADLAAKALDANLFIFPGHYIGEPDGRFSDSEYEYQYNVVFDLPTTRNVDILYVLMGTIGSRADKEIQKAFVDSLPRVPIVTLFADIEGYPSVTFDNETGIISILDHLTVKHGARKIGYVSGPKTNKDADERLSAFRKYVTDRGLPLEDSQIVYGDFTEKSHAAVEKLLDDNEDIDAVVFANDSMAIGGYEVFEKRGLVPGKDILAAGFDNDVFTPSMTPPLTTVETSSADLTYKAVLAANDFIHNGRLNKLEVKTYLVQRASCGCAETDIEEIRHRLHVDGMVSGDRKYIDSIRKYLFGVFLDNEHITMVKSLLEVFCISCSKYFKNGRNRNRVDRTFRNMVDSDILKYCSTEKLFTVLLTLQNEGLKTGSDKEQIYDMFAEYYRILSLKGLTMINSYRDREDRVFRMLNNQMGNIFTGSHDDRVPYHLLLKGFDKIGFRQSFLYFFPERQDHPKGQKWECPGSLLLAACFGKDGILSPGEKEQLISTENLFINEFVDAGRRLTMMVSPLFAGERLYGLMVNELNVADISMVSLVAHQLSVTVRSLI